MRSDGTYKITSFNFADNAIFYDTSQRWIRNVNFLNNLEQLSIARHEVEIDLDELIKISSELVKDRGYFYLVHRADRLSEILNILQKYKLHKLVI